MATRILMAWSHQHQKEENENRALFLVKKWKSENVEFSIVDISAPGGPRANPSSFLNALYRSVWSQLSPYQISARSDNVYHINILNSKAFWVSWTFICAVPGTPEVKGINLFASNRLQMKEEPGRRPTPEGTREPWPIFHFCQQNW